VNSESASCPPAPLGKGFLTGTIRSTNQFDKNDFRASNPLFIGENFQRNPYIADVVTAIAGEVGATPAQVAIPWLLTKGDDIAPIPGTKRVEHVTDDEYRAGAEQV
jgi:aryl-alcohol dehydrogenase-like predicted oxidoreductase